MDFQSLSTVSFPLPVVVGIILIVIGLLGLFKPSVKPVRINNKVKLEEAKVVDIVACADMEDLAQFKDGKLVMCRCWKSQTFPYCDGSHVKHNKECNDNVGPLIVKK